MKMLVLDGYNVIHAMPELAKKLEVSLAAARDALIQSCRAYHARHKDVHALYIVFDGNNDGTSFPRTAADNLFVVYTPRREEADERILRLLREDRSRHTFVIVSNDTYLFNNCRAHGAHVLSVAEFAGALKPRRLLTPRPQEASEKTPLSLRDANAITEAYRQHLERRAKDE